MHAWRWIKTILVCGCRSNKNEIWLDWYGMCLLDWLDPQIIGIASGGALLILSKNMVRRYGTPCASARLVFHFLFPHLLLVSEASAASLCWIRPECSNLTMWRHILLRFCNRHLHDDHVSTHWYDPLSRKIQISNHIIQWPSLKAHYFIQPTFKSSHLNYQSGNRR